MALPSVTGAPIVPVGYEVKNLSRGRSGISVNVSIEGLKEIRAAYRIMESADAPYLRKGIEKGTDILARSIQAGVPFPSFKVVNRGVKGKGLALRGVIDIAHKGARSMEFGRTWYYRGFTGRAQKATGFKFKVSSGGQQARPFLGIISGGGAVDKVRGQVEDAVQKAMIEEWEDLTRRMGVAASD